MYINKGFEAHPSWDNGVSNNSIVCLLRQLVTIQNSSITAEGLWKENFDKFSIKLLLNIF